MYQGKIPCQRTLRRKVLKWKTLNFFLGRKALRLFGLLERNPSACIFESRKKTHWTNPTEQNPTGQNPTHINENMDKTSLKKEFVFYTCATIASSYKLQLLSYIPCYKAYITAPLILYASLSIRLSAVCSKHCTYFPLMFSYKLSYFLSLGSERV